MTQPRICIITPGHLASAPRVVKEADALAGAGYQVHVVAGQHYAPVDPLDAELLGTAKWSLTRVDYRGGFGTSVRKLLRKAARAALPRLRRMSVGIAARAHHSEALHFGRVAACTPAVLYIGHCLAGLPAAAHAAHVRGTHCGFDAEDFHDAETLEAANGGGPDARAPRVLHAKLLPRCRHLTAASPLIGAAIRDAYGVHAATVLNAFPRSYAPPEMVFPGPITPANPARIYWFSQTIGPGRGLENTISVLARLRTPVELRLRGFVSERYREELSAFANQAGLARRIIFLPPAPPAEMARLAADSHLGLSSEEPIPRNRDLCLTNKIFIYLLAGLPQLLTPTTAQRAFATELGTAGLLFDPDNIPDSVAKIDALLSDPSRLATARALAWRMGETRFSWEYEQTALIDSVRATLARPTDAAIA